MRPLKVIGAVAPATLAALLLVACGDDGDGGGTLGTSTPGPDPGGTSLMVEAHDTDFDRDAYRAAAGPVDVEYVQEGALPHTLLIESADGGGVDGFELEVGDRDSDRGTVDLPAGEYVVYCDVPGHREAGMEAELEVGP